MKKSFYSTFIDIKSIHIELDKLNISREEKEELILLIDSNIHCEVLDLLLSELSKEDKKKFLNNLKENDHENILKHIKGKIENVEEKIKNKVEDLKVKLTNDISSLKDEFENLS